MGHCASGDGQDPQAFVGEGVDQGVGGRSVLEVAAVQDDLGGTLDDQLLQTTLFGGWCGAEGGGVATAGLERHLQQHLPVGVGGAGGGVEDGFVGGVGVALVHLGAGARPGSGLQQHGHVGVGDVGVGGTGGVPGVGEGDQAQLVLGEGAGLVEAHRVDPAQGLQGAGAADQDPVFGQPPGGRELGEGRHQRQALGDGGDGDGDTVGNSIAQGASAQQRQTGDRRPPTQGQRQGLAGELHQAGLHTHGGPDSGDGGDSAARGGRAAGRHDDGPGVPGDDGAALEDHARPLRRSRPRGGLDLFGHRHRLTGERGLVDLQVVADEQAGIGGNHIGGLEDDDVTGAQAGRGHQHRP